MSEKIGIDHPPKRFGVVNATHYASAEDMPVDLGDDDDEANDDNNEIEEPRQRKRRKRTTKQETQDEPSADDVITEPKETNTVTNMKFNSVADVEALIESKTKEYNDLRKPLLQPIFYNVDMREMQNTFIRISKEIDHLKSLKSHMTDDLVIGGVDFEQMVDELLHKVGSIESEPAKASHMESSLVSVLCPKRVFGRKQSRAPPPQQKSASGVCGAFILAKERREYEKTENDKSEERRKRSQQHDIMRHHLKFKDASDKDKPDVPTQFDAEKERNRRIKYTLSDGERSISSVLAEPVAAAAVVANSPLSERSRDVMPCDGDIVCDQCGYACDVDDLHGEYVCTHCSCVNQRLVGEGDMRLSGSMMSTAKTCVFKSKASTYKPLGHFTEIMYQLQGKRKCKAPYHVKKACRDYCISYGIKRMDITETTIRKCLKQYKNGSQYYKYAMEIACDLQGVPPPCMTGDQEGILTYMYPYTVHAYKSSRRYLMRKSNRVGRIKKLPNNMVGNYVLYKLCELCGFTEFLPYIRLSKNVANITENDESWQHICKINNWKFFRTKIYE